MATAIKALSRIQVGKETVRGTAVAAARRLVLNDGTYTREETFETFEESIMGTGTLARTSRAPILTRNHTMFEYTQPLSFQDFLLPLLSGVKGGVTGVGVGDDKTWAFLPGAAADPVPDTYTVEFVESDGVNNAEMEAPYGFTTGFEVSGGVEALPELSVSMVARKTIDSTMTPALTVPVLNFAPSIKWDVYVDGTWAGLGTTPVLGQVYEFTYSFEWLRPQWYLDSRADLDFSIYEHTGPRIADLSFDVVVDAAGAGFVQTEEALKSAGTPRFVQLKLLGPTLGASNYTITIDGCYYHADDSMAEAGGDRDGNMMRSVHLISAYDPISANDVQYTVVNDLSAYP